MAILGCLIERESDISGSVEGYNEGGNEGFSGNEEVSGIDEVSSIGEVSGEACGNEVDSIGLLLLDNVRGGRRDEPSIPSKGG